MLIQERMTHPVITIRPETSMQEAYNLMRDKKIRRLPVVEKHDRLVGIVCESDVLRASPSDATSLSVWEIHYLLSKLKVEQIMTREVVSVAEDTPLEEAACIMSDRKIGGLPVVRDGKVVGIITETDLFRAFLELLGARQAGIRVTVAVPNLRGELARLTRAVSDAGGEILSLGTFGSPSATEGVVVFKVTGIGSQALRAAIEPAVTRLVDLRETPAC